MRAILTLTLPQVAPDRSGSTGLPRVSRGTMTEAELQLWSRLRDAARIGGRFRRMCAIGPWIVDFACLERRVVVEIAGGPDPRPETEGDPRRDAFLADRGFRVLRFPNDAVLANPDAVQAAVAAALAT